MSAAGQAACGALPALSPPLPPVSVLMQVANTTKGTDLPSLWCMITKCGTQIMGCVQDATCKGGLDCLEGCAFNDQVGTLSSEGRGARHVMPPPPPPPAPSLLSVSTLMHACLPPTARLGLAPTASAADICCCRAAAAVPLLPPLLLLQVCQYRCIVSYETPLFGEFALCILQKHNCRGLTAEPPKMPGAAATRRRVLITH